MPSSQIVGHGLKGWGCALKDLNWSHFVHSLLCVHHNILQLGMFLHLRYTKSCFSVMLLVQYGLHNLSPHLHISSVIIFMFYMYLFFFGLSYWLVANYLYYLLVSKIPWMISCMLWIFPVRCLTKRGSPSEHSYCLISTNLSVQLQRNLLS